MTTTDAMRKIAVEMMSGLGLLTRLPVASSGTTAAACAWTWPVVGVIIGLIGAFCGWLALTMGMPHGVAATAVMAAQIIATGAMHEDGLADSADGLWGGWDRARRLEIMKDSHIGTYGVLALLLCGLARWAALTALLSATPYYIAVLVVTGALSRTPMVAIMAILPNARGSGLSQSVGRPDRQSTVVAAAIAGVLTLVLLGWLGLVAMFAVAVTALVLAAVAKQKIGGQTGDILGASQVLAEVAALAVIAA